MLLISNLFVSVGPKEVLRGVSLEVPPGELHVLLGPNGSGKSSLLSTIMGLNPFEVGAGDVRFNGKSILDLPTYQRARLGIGLAFQHPPSVAGVRVDTFARALGAEERLRAAAEELDLNEFEGRSLATGFSGGEVKRWEVLKLGLQQPGLLLLDEPDSGVDLEHVRSVGRAIERLMSSPGPNGAQRAGLLITHSGLILEHLRADRAHVLIDGQIIYSGDPETTLRRIQRHGYASLKENEHVDR